MLLDNLFVKMELQADQFKRGIGDAASASTSFFSKINSEAQESSGRFSSTMDTLSNVAGAIGLVGLGASAFTKIKESVLGMNASLESTTLQFATLMGNSDKAKEHVAGLFEFAKSTPFETEPIIQASRHFQVFGGEALNTQDNLMLMGNATSAVGADFERVGFWTGRLYNALQAGKPFGEAAQELMTMGIASPQVIEQMQKMQEQGKTGAEVWGVWTQDMQRFNGSMATQASTFSGMASTLSDQLAMLGANAFKPFFDLTVQGLTWITTQLGSETFNTWIQDFATGLANLTSGGLTWLFNTGLPLLKDGFNFVSDIVANYVIPAFRELSPTFDTIVTAVEKGIAIWDRFKFVFGATDSVTIALESVRSQLEKLGPAGQFIANMIPHINDLIRFIQDLGTKALEYIDPIIPLVQRAIDIWQSTASIRIAIRDLINNLSDLGPAGEAVETVLEAIGGFISSTLVPGVESLIDKVISIASEFGIWENKGIIVKSALGGVKDLATGLVIVVGDLTAFVRDNVAAQAVLVGILTSLGVRYAITTAASVYHAAVTKGLAATTAIMTGAQTALNFVLSANPIGIVVLAIAALAAGLVYAYNNSETFRNAVDRAWEVVKKFASDVMVSVGKLKNQWQQDWAAIKLALSIVGTYISTTFTTAVNGIATAFQWVIDKVNAFKQRLDGIKNALPDWLTPGSPTPLENGLRGISDAFKGVNEKDIPKFKALLELLEKVPAMEIIDQFTPPTEEALRKVGKSVRLMVDVFSESMAGVKAKTMEGISQFTEGAGKVVELFGKAAENFNKASTYTGVFEDTLASISDRIIQVANHFTEAAKVFKAEMLANTSLYADAASKSVDSIGKAVDNFSKIKDYEGVSYDIVWNLAQDIEKTIDIMHLVASRFDTAMLVSAGSFSEAAGKVMGLVKDAIEGFKGVNEYRGTVPDLIWALAQDIEKATELMGIIASNADKEGVEAASWFATSVKSVFDLFKTGVESLDAIRNYQQVPKERMVLVLADFELATGLMAQIASRANIVGIKIANTFATASKAIFDLFKAGTDALDALRKYESVPRERMQAFFNDFMQALNLMNDAKSESSNFANAAQIWAQNMEEAFKALERGASFYNKINNMPDMEGAPQPDESSRTLANSVRSAEVSGVNSIQPNSTQENNSKQFIVNVNQNRIDDERSLRELASAYEMAWSN